MVLLRADGGRVFELQGVKEADDPQHPFHDAAMAFDPRQWPDDRVMWHGTLFLVGLKTDPTRAVRQVNDELRLARPKHPLEPIDHVFVTVRQASDSPHLDDGMAYRNVTWGDLVPYITKRFPAERDGERLCSFIKRILKSS